MTTAPLPSPDEALPSLEQAAHDRVWAGNTLNRLMYQSDLNILCRTALWLAYYPLMREMARDYTSIQRMIAKRYETIERIHDDNFVMSEEVE